MAAPADRNLTVVPARFAARRAAVMRALGEDAALVLAATPEVVVGRDTELPYYVDAEIYYLTGYEEPEAVLVLVPSNKEHPFTLFVRPRDATRELWTGPRGGVEAATATFGAAAAHPISELNELLPKLLANVNTIYARLQPPLETLLRDALVSGRRTRARSGRGPMALIDPGVLLDDVRRVKDADEIALIRRATELTVAGFHDALGHIRPGAGEWQVQAALEAGFRTRGADGWAFPSIVAAGRNATVLHYIANDQPLHDGDLLLIDAGARYRHYCGDITRTFPVNGQFTAAQRRVYEIVLAAHDAAIGASRVGATMDDVHNAAQSALTSGLRELGLLETGLSEQDEEARVKKYYPHKTSHWLGIEVHDVGAYTTLAGPVTLEPGMVYTVEPGLYIAPDDTSAPAELRGIGVRIEDDVLITLQGAEVLTSALPTAAAEIERLMRSLQ